MNQAIGRDVYSLREFYTLYHKAFFSIPDFVLTKRKALLSEEFSERIMLAVTEVNGCPVCSYVHTKIALEAGMSGQEIQKMLAGINEEVPDTELPAVMFAQHYAETRGLPTQAAWERVVEVYGLPKAKGILGAIRIMMFGNATGVAWGSFVNRFKKDGKADERSTLLYELGMILGSFLYLPLALVHALFAKLIQRPVLTF